MCNSYFKINAGLNNTEGYNIFITIQFKLIWKLEEQMFA